MSATSPSEFRTGIGARLKAGRERLGLTLLQLAEKLHVDASVVEKLEAERFGEFDAPVYVKGHIKRYSEVVGENTQELLDSYAAATKPVLPDLTQLPKASQHSTDPRKLVLPSLVVLIAFALIGTVWWVLQNVGKLSPPAVPQPVQVTDEGAAAAAGNDTAADAAQSPGATSETSERSSPAQPERSIAAQTAHSSAGQPLRSGQTPAPAQPSASNSATTASNSQQHSSAAQTERSSAGETARTGQTPPPASPPATARRTGTRAGTTAGAASTAQITKTTKLAATTPTSAPTSPPEPQQRSKPIDVTLKFAADSWAEVYDANGQRLFYDIGSANSAHAVTGTPPLRVVLGNAPGVTVNINGRPTKVPAAAVQNDSAQFTINRSGRIVRARPDEAAPAASKANGE